MGDAGERGRCRMGGLLAAVALALFVHAALPVVFSLPAAAQDGVTIYLFRHAEKDTMRDDPPLTAQGAERARTLLGMIAEPEVHHLFSTDLRRTRDTIAPFSTAHDLPIRIYDPRSLEAFADTLRSLRGVALVSGHSNTTPELVRMLGGREVPDIDESEYDNLYIVTLTGDVRTVVRLRVPPFFEPPGR